MLIDDIGKYIREGRYKLTDHARIRMFQRHIRTDDLEDLLINGEIVETDPNGDPCPTARMVGRPSGRLCEAVIACCDDGLHIVTLYWLEEGRC